MAYLVRVSLPYEEGQSIMQLPKLWLLFILPTLMPLVLVIMGSAHTTVGDKCDPFILSVYLIYIQSALFVNPEQYLNFSKIKARNFHLKT